MWDRSEPYLRYPIEVRDSKLAEILGGKSWIIEGAHFKWGQESFNKADLIFILTPNRFIRDFRVILRFIKTRIGVERSNYKQTLKNLFQMIFVWNRDYDKENLTEIMKLTDEYDHKRVIVKNNKEILQYLSKKENL